MSRPTKTQWYDTITFWFWPILRSQCTVSAEAYFACTHGRHLRYDNLRHHDYSVLGVQCWWLIFVGEKCIGNTIHDYLILILIWFDFDYLNVCQRNLRQKNFVSTENREQWHSCSLSPPLPNVSICSTRNSLCWIKHSLLAAFRDLKKPPAFDQRP